jgi:predicted RNA binding protein YcfA (HicA-like mRNA interferase family)
MSGDLDKILALARRNPSGLSFRQLEHLLTLAKWKFERQTGSHRIWKSPGGRIIPFQPLGRKAKGYQVRQFLAQYDREGNANG